MNITYVDDSLDSRIMFSGVWFEMGATNGYLGTSKYTVSQGSSAMFNFTGTSIGVYGTIFAYDPSSVDPISSYTIDSGLAYQYTGLRQANHSQYLEMFFRVSNLTATPHTLVITNMVERGWLCLEFFRVEGDTDESTSTLLSKKHRSSFVGATVGGAIAGFAVFCLILYSCFLYSRRRHQKKTLQLPTTQNRLPPYPEIPATQHPSNITPFVVKEPSQSTLPPYPEIPPAQQRQHITPFVVGEPSHQPLAGPSQSNTKQERSANENGSSQAYEGVVAPSYTKNPLSAGERQVSAGERLLPFSLEASPGAQQQRPSDITPFIVGELWHQPLEGLSQQNEGGRAKQGHNANENESSPAPEGVIVPSSTNAPLPAGERRVSDGERQQVADLPPAYTALPDVG